MSFDTFDPRADPESSADADADVPTLRTITDPLTLRALAHPVRMALIEALSIDGPLTATEASEIVGQSPSACSFHLRQLARFGFVEETGEGSGRKRPWRMTSIGFSIPDGPEAASPEGAVAAHAVSSLLLERQLERHRTWLATRGSYPKAWREATFDSEFAFWVTPDELRALSEELLALLLPRFRDRLTDASARPAGAMPIELLMLAFPMRAPQEAQS